MTYNAERCNAQSAAVTDSLNNSQGFTQSNVSGLLHLLVDFQDANTDLKYLNGTSPYERFCLLHMNHACGHPEHSSAINRAGSSEIRHRHLLSSVYRLVPSEP